MIRNRFLLTIVLPMVAISLLLFGVGAAAALNVHSQQAETSMLIAREVESMLAVQGVDVGMREIRHQLNQYVRRGDERYFDRIRPLHEETEAKLERAKALAHTPGERELIGIIDEGYRRFWDEFQKIDASADPDRRQAFGQLVDKTLTDAILVPGQRYIDYSREVVKKTGEASRNTSEQLRQGFLLLGVCGGAAGLIAGVGIARALSRSIVQLEISVRSAAGRLNAVAGPVRISRVAGLRELQADLHNMENHIADVVERLQRSEMEVLRNEQLAALGQLAAGVAHELRNPLTPMKMLVQAALERDDGAGLKGRQLQVVEEEIERLERSIQTFLDFARPTPLVTTQFNLVSIVEQTLELIAGRAERQGVVLRDALPVEPVDIEADSGQLRQVLLNLLLNALDAMPEGGQIAVELDVAGSQTERGAPADFARLCITDSGPGFPPELLGRIFEPFVTTKETGTGLGLSICQRIVTQHGGTIRASNRPSGGAEFVIHLPCARAPAPVPALSSV